MSETTSQLRVQRQTRAEASGSAAPAWWVIFRNEAHSLWIGGKAPILLLLFSIVLGAHAFVTAFNVELSLMPPAEMIYETVKTAMSVGLFMGMIIGADMFSGERERGTLEALLLTPTGRRQIVIGKFLAALTPWPAALLLAFPFMTVLGQGHEILGPAVLWGAFLGTILVVAYTGTGLLVSFWSNTNRTSYLVSLGIFILILVPSQLPGRAQTGAAGQFLQQLNPLAAANHFLSKILVNNETVEEWVTWLWTPVLFAVLAVVLLIAYSAPGLRLEAGRARLTWRRPGGSISSGGAGRAAGLIVLLSLFLVVNPGSTNASTRPVDRPVDRSLGAEAPVEITVDLDYRTVSTGDAVFFDTVVRNPHAEATAPMVVAMNIINLDQEGDVVDPEDWSPERTQYVERLDPGDAVTLSWRVNAILDGDYIVYMVVMPEPAGRDATSQAVASAGVHLTVMPFTRLNPRGVVPLVIGTPLVLGMGTFLVLMIRRRDTEGGAPLPRYLRPGVVAIAVVMSIGALSAVAIGSQSAAASNATGPEPSAAVSPNIQPSPPVAVGGSSDPGASPGASQGPGVSPSAPASTDPAGSPSAPASGAIALQIDTGTEPEDFAYAESTLTASAGSTITLTLNNLTDMDDEIGHNWVLVEPGQEQVVLASGIAAGDNGDWLDVHNPAIVAFTALIEGGDSASVTFEAPPPGIYPFVCTFPEHYANGMLGTLTIE